MKNYFIEKYDGSISFPFLGRGFCYTIRRDRYGFGITFVRGHKNYIHIMLGVTIELSAIGYNHKVYRNSCWEKYVLSKRKGHKDVTKKGN